ncbi:hemicentin-2-like isoform X2 [Lissotriton helveticus]
MNLFPKTCCFFSLLAFLSVLSETVTKYTLNARSGQEIAINCSARPSTQLSARIWKIKTHNMNCVMSFRAQDGKTFKNCSEHLRWKPGYETFSVLLINPVGIKDDGIYICETSSVEGTYFSNITLNVQVPPVVTLTSEDPSTAVCRASGGKPAANISWHPACESCITEQQVHPDRTVSVISTYRASSEHETLVRCVVSHPTFLEAQNKTAVNKYTLNARSGQEIAINCSARPSTQLSARIWKITTHNMNCIMVFRAHDGKTFKNCSEHLRWKPGYETFSVLLINPVGIKDDGIYICETSNVDGTYFSNITLNVQVPPVVTLTSEDPSTAVCRASGGKPAANISWHPACESCITEQQVHPDKTVTVVSTYRASSEHETLVTCVVSHPTFLEAQNKTVVPPVVTLTSEDPSTAVCRASRGKPAANISWHPACESCITEQQVHPDRTVTVVSTYRASNENETLVTCVVSHPTFLEAQNKTIGVWSSGGLQAALTIRLPIVLCFITFSSILVFLLFKRPQVLRRSYKCACSQNTSLHRKYENTEILLWHANLPERLKQ